MAKKSGVAAIVLSLVLGTGLGAAAGGCGEDRGSVDVEGGTTGTVGTTGTTGTTSETTGTTETTDTSESSGPGY
jgi:hypothetical protein